MRKMVKRALLGVSVVIAGVCVIPCFMDWNSYKEQICLLVNKHSAYHLDIKGDLSLRLLPTPHMRAADVHVHTKNQKAAFAQIKKISLQVALMPLIKRQLVVEHASISDGVVVIENADQSAPTEIKNICIDGALTSANVLDMDLSFSVKGVHIKGTLKGEQVINFIPQKASGALDVTSDYDVKGKVEIDVAIVGQSYVLKLKGNNITAPFKFDVGDTIIDFTAGADLFVNATHDADKLKVTELLFTQEQQTLKGAGEYSLKPKKGIFHMSTNYAALDLKGDITVDLNAHKPWLDVKMDLKEWGRKSKDNVVKKKGAHDHYADTNDKQRMDAHAQNAASKRGERWAKDSIDLSSLQHLNGNYSIAIGRVYLDGYTLLNPHIVVHAKDGRVDVKNCRFGVADGTVNMTGSINVADAVTTCDLSAQNIHLDQVTSLIGTPLKKGVVQLSAQLRTQALSVESIVRSLTGKIKLSANDALITAFDLKQFVVDLKALRKFDDLSKLKEDVNRKQDILINTVRCDVDAKDGVLNIVSGHLETTEANLSVTGQVLLPAWKMQLKPALQIKGEKRFPAIVVDIAGPIDEPAFNIDFNDLQKMLMQIAVNQVSEKAEQEVKKQIQKQLEKVIPHEVGNGVAKEAAKAIGKVLPSLFGR